MGAALLSLLAAGSAALAQAPPNWAVFVQRSLRDSATPRFRSDLEKARHIMHIVGDEMHRLGIPVNTDASGRLLAGVTTGSMGYGTCSTADEILQVAFAGAGFADYQAFQVVGEPSSTKAKIKAGVNRNHVGVGLVLDGRLYMFDLWAHARQTGSWAGARAGKFAGIPFPTWVERCEIYDTFWWENARTKTFTPGILGGLQKRGRTAAETAVDIMLDYNTGRKANDAGNARKAQNATRLTPGERPGAAVPHWELVGTHVERQPQPPQGERLTVAGGDGSLSVELRGLDGWGRVLSTQKSRLVWSYDDPHQVLMPGDTLRFLITLSHESDGNNGGAAFVEWGPLDGRGGDLARVDITSHPDPRDPRRISGQLGKRGTLPIPFGTTQGEKAALRFHVSNSQTGTAAVRLTYEWTPGRVPGATVGSPGAAWAGRWDSDWGTMEFSVTGKRVTATCAHKNGRLEGEVSENGLRFRGRWTQDPTRQPPQDAGAVELDLRPDGRTFTGSWWRGWDRTAKPSGTWGGRRKS